VGQVNLVGVVGTAGLQGSVGADAYVCAIVQALQRKNARVSTWMKAQSVMAA